jgi:hypothetical protein
MRTFLIFISIIFSATIYGQHKHLNIGFRDNGLCFGNSKKNNGIRLNLWDRDVNTTNGINISGFVSARSSNGIGIGLVACNDSISNGIRIGTAIVAGEYLNGIAIGGIAIAMRTKFNGLGISGFWLTADTMNGVFLSAVGSSTWSTDSIKIINGVSIGIGSGVECIKLNGFAVGATNHISIQNGVTLGLLNSTKNLHGFQFGIWNIAENNKIFKKSPILNFNLRRKASR